MCAPYTDNKRSNYILEIRAKKRHIHDASVQSISSIESRRKKRMIETMKT